MTTSANSERLRYVLWLLAALAIFLVATAPAWLMTSLVSSFSHDEVQFEQPEGSFWKGRAAVIACTFSDGSRQRLEGFSWDILLWRLIRGQIAARLALTDSRVSGNGIAGLGPTGLFVGEIDGSISADIVRAMLPILDLWKPGGTVHINTGKALLEPLQIVEPATIQWKSASVGLANVPPLGDYQLNLLPTGDNLKLELKTTSGALLISGNGQYLTKSGGEFHGKAQAAPGFSSQLTSFLQLLGPADNDGTVNLMLKLPAFK